MNRRKYIASLIGVSGMTTYKLSNNVSQTAYAKITQFDISKNFSSVSKDKVEYVSIVLNSFILNLKSLNTKKDLDITFDAKFENDANYTTIKSIQKEINSNGELDLSNSINPIKLFSTDNLDSNKFSIDDEKNIQIKLKINHSSLDSEVIKKFSFTIKTSGLSFWYDNFGDSTTKKDYITTQMNGSNNGNWVFGIDNDDANNIDDYYTTEASPTKTSYVRSDNSNDRYILSVNPSKLDISDSVTVRSDYLGSGDDDTSGIHIYDEENGIYWMAGIDNDAGINGIQIYDEINDTQTHKSDLNTNLDSSSRNVHNRQKFELIYDSTEKKLTFYINKNIASEYTLNNNENIKASSGGLIVRNQSKNSNVQRYPGSAFFDNLEIINDNIFGDPNISNVRITDNWQNEPTTLSNLYDNDITTGVTDGTQYDQNNDTNEFDGGDIIVEYESPITVNKVKYDLDLTYNHTSSWSRYTTKIIVSDDTNTEEIFYEQYTSGTTENIRLNESNTVNISLDTIKEIRVVFVLNGGGTSSQSVKLNVNYCSTSLPEYN